VRAPREIILDLDATDDPLHGMQEGRFFNGYYDCYCYLPLYVLATRGARNDLACIEDGTEQDIDVVRAEVHARTARAHGARRQSDE
jgi:hypothetical protein